MKLNWVQIKYKSNTTKSFNCMIDDYKAITVYCFKNTLPGQPWNIEVHGWNKPSYRFIWRERFNKDKVFNHLEKQLEAGIPKLSLAVFNAIFEKK